MQRVRLIRKYASALNGFDLRSTAVGDVFVVNDEIAAMLAREGWTEPANGDTDSGRTKNVNTPTSARDSSNLDD